MSGRWLSRRVAMLFLLLLLNTAYIAAFASPTVFYMGNVLLHVLLGAVARVKSASGAQWQMVHSGSTSRSRGAGS